LGSVSHCRSSSPTDTTKSQHTEQKSSTLPTDTPAASFVVSAEQNQRISIELSATGEFCCQPTEAQSPGFAVIRTFLPTFRLIHSDLCTHNAISLHVGLRYAVLVYTTSAGQRLSALWLPLSYRRSP